MHRSMYIKETEYTAVRATKLVCISFLKYLSILHTVVCVFFLLYF